MELLLTLFQMTNFRLFQTETTQTTILNLRKMVEILQRGKKILWGKKKLFFTSNFSFSNSVFDRLVLQTCKNHGLFGKGLIIPG